MQITQRCTTYDNANNTKTLHMQQI